MSMPEADTRARVFDCVLRYPGIHLRGVERELGISSALVHYHVKALEGSKHVVTASIGGHLRIFPRDLPAGRALSPEDADVLASLREELAFHLVLILLDSGPTPQSALVEELALAKSTVSYHLDKLIQRGLVERVERAGGERVIRLKEPARVRRLLLQYEPTSDLIERFRSLWDDFYEP